MNEIYTLFRKALPYCVRSEQTVMGLLNNPDCRVFEARDDSAALIGAAVVHKNNVLLLCVDEAHRRKGVGSRLLAQAEQTVREGGYEFMTVGAGEGYIMPGAPSNLPILPEDRLSECTVGCPDDSAARFFAKHGYEHTWGCNCFDMVMNLDEFTAKAANVEGVIFRRAQESDIDSVVACALDAEEDFAQYYRNPALYAPDSVDHVMMAEADGMAVGAVIVETGDNGTGCVGCTSVREAYQGRKIATNLVIHGTESLKSTGAKRSFIGYTYSGLDCLYGRAGYQICTYYLMGQKAL